MEATAAVAPDELAKKHGNAENRRKESTASSASTATTATSTRSSTRASRAMGEVLTKAFCGQYGRDPKFIADKQKLPCFVTELHLRGADVTKAPPEKDWALFVRIETVNLRHAKGVTSEMARRSSAEHLIATKALHRTATAWILTVAESFAKF